MLYSLKKQPYSAYSKYDYKKAFNGTNIPNKFSHNSGNNTEWESIESLRKFVRIHIDPNFKI